MKIRLMGSPQEVESGIQRIKEIFPVISISREYPNRNSADVRVYMEVIVSSGNELSLINLPPHGYDIYQINQLLYRFHF